MYFNSSASLLNNQICQNFTQSNGNRFCASTQMGESSADEHETDEKISKIGPVVTLHNCLNQLEKCTVKNCALNIFDNVVVKEELIIDDYEDSESVIENYYYDSFEKWSEFGQPLKTFLQNSNFNYHVEGNYLSDKMLEDTISNNSSYDESLNSLTGNDKTIVIRNQEWFLEKVFKSEALVKSYLEEQNWSLRVRYNTQYGKKSLYRCNLVKNKMPQCAAKVSMEYNKKSKSFLVYSNRRKHTHGTILLDHSTRDRDVRQKVRELVDLGLSKYEIQLHLENNGYHVPSDTLVNKSRVEHEPIVVKPIEMKPKVELYSKIDNTPVATKWILEKKFANSEFALQYMKQTGVWGICSKKRGRKHDKQYYRCNRVRKVGPQCAAQKYLLMDHTTGEGFLFGLNEHTHDLILSMAGGSTTQNVVIKKEPNSDYENDENYEYYGYDKDERKIEETFEPLHENGSAVFSNINGWQNGSLENINKIDDDNSNDRLSSLSSDANKNNDHFWILNRTFKTGAMAKLYLNEHKIWKLKHRELNGIGLKCIYRCGLVEATTIPQCSAMAYAQYHVKNDKVFFYTNSVEHTHVSIFKDDSVKKFNKLFRNHPKDNGLNSHIKIDFDTSESETYTKIEIPRERHSLRNIKLESIRLPADLGSKSPEMELLEYTPPKKRVLPWKLEEEFDKIKDALLYMQNKLNWYMWKKQNFKHGGSSKSYYRCTIRVDNIHCPAQKHLFVDKASNKISIYRCHEHIHEPSSPIPGSPIPYDNNTSEMPTSIDVIAVGDTINENSTLTDQSNSSSIQLSCSTNGTWGNNWQLEKKFTNMTEAIQYMKGEEIWSICGKLKVLSGFRQYYRCNLVKTSGPQCDSRKYLFFNTPTTEVLLYGCNSHTHDLILSQSLKSALEFVEEDKEDDEEQKDSLVETEEKRYIFERKFKNLDLALSYIKEANTWSHHSTLKSLTGVRRYYLCKLRGNRKCSLKCPARCCLSIKSAKQEVCLYNRSCSHTHPVPYKSTKKKNHKKSCRGSKSTKKSHKVAKSHTKSYRIPEPLKQTNNAIRQYHSWNLERNFINSEYALKYMKREKIWSIFSKRRATNGNEIQYYRCNEVKKTGPQCAAQKYLVFHSNRAKVSLYGRNEHTHDSILAGNNDECHEDEIDNSTSNNDSVVNTDTENQNDEIDDEPLNENLYAVDVVIEEDEYSEPKTYAKPRRGRGLGLNYVFEKKFRSPKTALSYIKSQKIWSVTFTGKTSNGYRQRFRCNLVSRKGPQCAARKYLIYDTEKGVQLYTSITDHTHDSIRSSLPVNDSSSYLNEDTLNRTTENDDEQDAVELPADITQSRINQSRATGKKPRQTWKRKLYNLERKFKNAQSAINYMKNQKDWGLHSKTKRKHDRKQYYRCNFVKVGGPQCQAGKFLLYSELKKEVSLFYCNNHTHDTILQNYSVNENDSVTEMNNDDDGEIESETAKISGESLDE